MPSGRLCRAFNIPPCLTGEVRDNWRLTWKGIPWHSEDIVVEIPSIPWALCADNSPSHYNVWEPWSYPCTQCPDWPDNEEDPRVWYTALPGTHWSASPDMQLDSACETNFWTELLAQDDSHWGILQYTGSRSISVSRVALVARFPSCPHTSGWCQTIILEAFIHFSMSWGCPDVWSYSTIQGATEGTGQQSAFSGGPFYEAGAYPPCRFGSENYEEYLYDDWASYTGSLSPSAPYFAYVMARKEISFRPCYAIDETLEAYETLVRDTDTYCSNSGDLGGSNALSGVTCDVEMVD